MCIHVQLMYVCRCVLVGAQRHARSRSDCVPVCITSSSRTCAGFAHFHLGLHDRSSTDETLYELNRVPARHKNRPFTKSRGVKHAPYLLLTRYRTPCIALCSMTCPVSSKVQTRLAQATQFFTCTQTIAAAKGSNMDETRKHAIPPSRADEKSHRRGSNRAVQ